MKAVGRHRQVPVRRPHVTAGVAIAAAGIVVAQPIVQPQPESETAQSRIASPAFRLTDASSWMNAPLNLFQDIVNIPAAETHGMSVLAQSLFYSGPWWVGSPTNIWGEDPGDAGHFEGLMQMAIPFPELSGAGHEGDLFFPGLGQQLAMLAAVEIPANLGCASLDCLPVMPTSPITGVTAFDQAIWSILIATGLQKFPLINNWFQVPFSDMMNGNSYYFDPTAPGLQDSGFANDGFYWTGTRTPSELGLDPNDFPNGDDTHLMPWAGQSYEMDFATPFTNFFNSLQQPFDPNGFEPFSLEDFGRALQALMASSIVAFNPFIPGSPLCPGTCLFPDGAGGEVPSYLPLVQGIENLWPGNPVIQEWLSAYDAGTANITPPEFIETEGWLWRLGQTWFDFANPMPDDPFIDTSGFLPTMDDFESWLGPYFYNIATNSGILAPFDIQGLWDAIFNVTSDAQSAAATDATTAATDAMADALTNIA
jgi:hypothetical protein